MVPMRIYIPDLLPVACRECIVTKRLKLESVNRKLFDKTTHMPRVIRLYVCNPFDVRPYRHDVAYVYVDIFAVV